MGPMNVSMTMCRRLAPVAIAIVLALPGRAAGDTLSDLANAELHLPTVCPAGATLGIYGSDLNGFVVGSMLETGEWQSGDLEIVERERLDDILAEHALAPFLDPATTPAADGLLAAKFLVLVEADITVLPMDLSVSMVRVDTQEVLYEHSSVVTEADGMAGLEARVAQIAAEIASLAVANNYACSRIGSLTYEASVSGNDWEWSVSGYVDVLIRESDTSPGSLEALVRHVPATNEVSGLLLSATDAAFPAVPALGVTPVPDSATTPPTAYAIQFQAPAAPAPNHTLVFAEPPNPVFNTGRENAVDFPSMAAIALGHWMNRDGNSSLQLTAAVTGDAPVTWTVPTGQGAMTLTWVLP